MKLNAAETVAPGAAAILVREMLELNSQALMSPKPVSHDET